MRLFTDRRLTFGLLCVALVAIYLTWWTTYATTSQGDHYRRLARGATYASGSGTARVVSLQAADELGDTKGGEPQVPDADAVWVVAVVEVQVQRATNRSWCDVQLVSTSRRVWPKSGTGTERSLPDCRDDDIVVGRPYRYEAVFEVPISDVDAIAGLALRDDSSRRRTPILTPPS